MDEILHHPRNPGMMIPLQMVSHGFKVVQDFVHPQYVFSIGLAFVFPSLPDFCLLLPAFAFGYVKSGASCTGDTSCLVPDPCERSLSFGNSVFRF